MEEKQAIDLDKGYRIEESFFESNKFLIDRFRDYINNKGYYEYYTGKVLEPYLLTILISDKIPCTIVEDEVPIIIDGKNFSESYLDGFHKGEEDFKQMTPTDPNLLYSKDAKQFIKDLHFNCYKKQYKLYDGWVEWKKFFPMVLKRSVVLEFGYFSGLLTGAEDFLDQYPSLYEEFLKLNQRSFIKRDSSLTQYEKALRLYYLNKAGEIDNRNWSKQYFIEIENASFGKFFSKMCPSPFKRDDRTPKRKELINVHESLEDYPLAKKAIENDLEDPNNNLVP